MIAAKKIAVPVAEIGLKVYTTANDVGSLTIGAILKMVLLMVVNSKLKMVPAIIAPFAKYALKALVVQMVTMIERIINGDHAFRTSPPVCAFCVSLSSSADT